MTAKLKRNYYLCPACKQDMRANPHPGTNGKYCPQCGQGIQWRKEANRRAPRRKK
jgi:Zn-finger nucleic acid-binding protein